MAWFLTLFFFLFVVFDSNNNNTQTQIHGSSFALKKYSGERAGARRPKPGPIELYRFIQTHTGGFRRWISSCINSTSGDVMAATPRVQSLSLSKLVSGGGGGGGGGYDVSGDDSKSSAFLWNRAGSVTSTAEKGKQFSYTGASIDYEHELNKLLAKSKGTAYEEALKRFVENKLLEQRQQLLLGERHKSESTRLYEQELRVVAKAEEEKAKERKQEQHKARMPEWLDEMAKPKERLVWKGKTHQNSGELLFDRMSTNHLGRQRPPSVSAEERQAMKEAALAAAAKNAKKAAIAGGGGGGEGTPMAVVAVGEFNKWVKDKMKWRKDVDTKINDLIEKEKSEAGKPCMVSNSKELSQLALQREAKRIESLLQSTVIGAAEEAANTINNSYSSKNGFGEQQQRGRTRTRSASPASRRPEVHANEYEKNLALAKAQEKARRALSPSVFERMSARVDAYVAQKRGTAAPHDHRRRQRSTSASGFVAKSQGGQGEWGLGANVSGRARTESPGWAGNLADATLSLPSSPSSSPLSSPKASSTSAKATWNISTHMESKKNTLDAAAAASGQRRSSSASPSTSPRRRSSLTSSSPSSSPPFSSSSSSSSIKQRRESNAAAAAAAIASSPSPTNPLPRFNHHRGGGAESMSTTTMVSISAQKSSRSARSVSPSKFPSPQRARSRSPQSERDVQHEKERGWGKGSGGGAVPGRGQPVLISKLFSPTSFTTRHKQINTKVRSGSTSPDKNVMTPSSYQEDSFEARTAESIERFHIRRIVCDKLALGGYVPSPASYLTDDKVLSKKAKAPAVVFGSEARNTAIQGEKAEGAISKHTQAHLHTLLLRKGVL